MIDLESRAVKGYHPGHKGNNCYNILMAFCDELKVLYVLEIHTPLMVLPKMIKEIIANLRDEVDNIVFRMDSGYKSEEIVEVIEKSGYQYVVKVKEYSKPA